MELKDFSEKEQQEIRKGLSTAEITDREAADKIPALVPEGWIRKIPFFVRRHATTKMIERIAEQYPEKEREELRRIITDIFQEKMKKHNIK